MKTFSALFFAILLASTNVRAEDLPTIKAPTYTQESYTLNLSQDEINILKKWSVDIKSDLKDAIKNAAELNGEAKLQYLKNEVEELSKRHKDQSNIFVRYSLNRSLKLVQIIEEQDQSSENSILDVKIRLLTQSLKTALEYASFDFKRFKDFGLSTYAQFGLDYFALVSELAKSVFDASSQYHMYKISLEYLQWDLYRETENTKYAPTIIKINRFLKDQSTRTSSDKQLIEEIRRLKKFITQLDIKQYQAAVETNEMEQIIKAAIDKNKGFDASLPFQENELVMIWNYTDKTDGELAIVTKVKDGEPRKLETVKDNKSYSYFVSKIITYRQNGCLKDAELCVGVPVLYYNAPAIILAVDQYLNSSIIQFQDGTKKWAHIDELFKRSGCAAKNKFCVGDKIIDGESKEIKFIKGIKLRGETYWFREIITGNSIYDDNLKIHELGNGDKLISRTEIFEFQDYVLNRK